MVKAKINLFIFLIIIVILPIIWILWKHILRNPLVNIPGKPHDTTSSVTIGMETRNKSISMKSIIPIKSSSHFAVSAFIDHRIKKAIRVISIIKRSSEQPLYCLYCNNGKECNFIKAEIEIHSDHFGFPFGASDVLCQGDHTQYATHVAITANAADEVSDINNLDFLPIKNRVNNESFKYNFTVCISNLFGEYSNVLQFAQSMEMYKLLGVQRVIIYRTSSGSDLNKLLQHYEKEGILEIVPRPINQFLNASSGWNIKLNPGDLHYYGQLVTLNECIYRQMYQSKYVLLNDIDEIIMPYKYANLPLLMEALQKEHNSVTVFLIENHIFPKTQFEDSGRFHLPKWKNISGINIMEHIYREPDRKNIYNPTKMIVNPRNMMQTSVHSSLKHIGDAYRVPFDVCRIIHVRTPLQGSLTKEQLFVDTRVWDFQQELISNVSSSLELSGLLIL